MSFSNSMHRFHLESFGWHGILLEYTAYFLEAYRFPARAYCEEYVYHRGYSKLSSNTTRR